MKRCYHSLLSLLMLPAYLTAQSSIAPSTYDKSKNERIRQLNQQSWEYHLSNPRKAIRLGKTAIKESRANRYWEGMAYAHKHTGAAYSVLGAYDSAYFYLKQAQRVFDESGNRTESGNASNLIGLLYWEKGQYDSALIAYDAAFKQFELTSDEEGKGIVYTNRGIIYYETGHYSRALSNYYNGLRIAETLRDSNTLSSVHTNIGIIYSITSNYKRAISHHRKALSIDNPIQNPSGCAKYYTNIGTCYFHLKQLDSSLIYHRKALQSYTRIGEKKGIARTLLNIGSIYQEKNQFSHAESCFRKGLALKNEIGDETGILIGELFLGKLYIESGNYAKAEINLLNAYNRARRLDAIYYKTEICLILAQLYDAMNQTSKANNYFQQYVRHNNRFVKEKGNHRLIELQIGLATHEKQRIIARLKQLQTKEQQQRYLLSISLIFTMIIAGFTIRFMRRRHKKRQLALEEELQKNKQVLEKFTLELAERSKENETVSDENEEKLQAMQQLGQARLITEEDWSRFKILFEKVHPLFMVGLKKTIPEITPAEMRLASLLLLQLTTREIASILAISPESVKKGRQRLRKKLQIPAETELELFLKQLSNN